MTVDESAMPSRTTLAISGLTVDFDGFKAVNGIDLVLMRGQLHFLIGPNGAGKTTLVDAVTGLAPGSRGQVLYAGVDLLTKKAHQITRLGVGRTFQTATVFEELTVLQNLDIAAGIHRKAWELMLPRRSTPDRVEMALEAVDLAPLADKPAGVLAHGQKQWLEIGMLLVQDAKVMLLDEPVAGMSTEEREQTGDLLRRIAAERTIVVIEHDMDFVRQFADWVTVMHAGRILTGGTVREVQADERVQEVYLGRTAAGEVDIDPTGEVLEPEATADA